MIYLIIFACLILLFLKVIWNYGNHAKNVLSTMSVPIIPGCYPFIGHGLSILNSKNMGEADIIHLKKYGDIYGICELYTPVVVVKDFSILREVLIKQFHCFTDRREIPLRGWMKYSLLDQRGEDWKRIRSILTPFFSTQKLKNCLPAIQECTHVCLKNLENMRLKDSTINISELASSLSFDVILSSAFSVHVDSQNDTNNPILKVIKQITNIDIMIPSLLLTFMFPFLSPIFEFFGITMWPTGYLKYFENVAIDLIRERKKDDKKYNDFLEVLVKCDEYLKEEGNEKKIKLSQYEIYAQMLLFFLAGFDTTSKALSFLLYFLSLHQDVQEKLLKEINHQLDNKEPDYENINKLDYLEAIISETLRLYPAVFRLDRVATEDVVISDRLTIKKGVSITIPVWAIHQDPNIWPDPQIFDPERFVGENKRDHDACSFMPFGLGPRSCIGVRFALMVLKIIVVRLIRKYKFSKSDLTEVPIELLSSGLLLQPARNIFLKVEPRKY